MAVHKYRVREGFTYGAKSEYGPGAIVELDDETAKHNMDKLELAEVVQNIPAYSTPEESAQMTASKTDSRLNTPENAAEAEEDEKENDSEASSSTRKSSLPRKKSGGD